MVNIMAFNIWNNPHVDIYALLRPILFLVEPETAHALVIKALQRGLGPHETLNENDPILKTKLFGLDFNNPIGLAAGFDKDAEAVNGSLDIGFGFAEFGCVTPLPQPGNPKPRVFRIPTASAVITRMGANSRGTEIFARNLQAWKNSPDRIKRPVGANLSHNKNSSDEIGDLRTSLQRISPFVDFVTISLSRPNQKGNRDPLPKEDMIALLSKFTKIRDELAPNLPIIAKMSIDSNEDQQADTASVTLNAGIQGLMIGGTSSSRPSNVPRNLVDEPGGLSGPPIFGPSTRILSNMYKLTGGKLPLIGNGGISSGADAYEKIRSGASLIQLYSALIFKGPGIVTNINKELAALLRIDGFNSISEAVGANHR